MLKSAAASMPPRLSPHPLETFVTSATARFGWALPALPSPGPPSQLAATAPEDPPPSGVRNCGHGRPTKTALCLGALVVRSPGESWTSTSLEHSTIQGATLKSPHVFLFQMFGPHADQFPPRSQRHDAKNRRFVFANFDQTLGRHHFGIQLLVAVRVRARIIMSFNAQSPKMSKELTLASSDPSTWQSLSQPHETSCC